MQHIQLFRYGSLIIFNIIIHSLFCSQLLLPEVKSILLVFFNNYLLALLIFSIEFFPTSLISALYYYFPFYLDLFCCFYNILAHYYEPQLSPNVSMTATDFLQSTTLPASHSFDIVFSIPFISKYFLIFTMNSSLTQQLSIFLKFPNLCFPPFL